jgi:hypothetical protein
MSAADAAPASERLDTASANTVLPCHTEIVEGWLESIGFSRKSYGVAAPATA